MLELLWDVGRGERGRSFFEFGACGFAAGGFSKLLEQTEESHLGYST
jgi:hypothetical protein